MASLPIALRWGLKSSLRRYVRSMPDGSITTEIPAELDAQMRAVFPGEWCADDGEAWDGLDVVARFSGALRFRGHGGLLDLVVSHPWLVRSGAAFELTIEDADDARGRSALAVVAPFVPPAAGAARISEAHLTALGAELFFANYRQGDELDAIEVVTTSR